MYRPWSGEHRTALAGPAPSMRVSRAVKPKVAVSKSAIFATARSTPVESKIPALSLAVSLSTLGLNADGTVQVPTDAQQPGWYGVGPSPGEIGSAVTRGTLTPRKVRRVLPSAVPHLRRHRGCDLGRRSHCPVRSHLGGDYLKTNFPDQRTMHCTGTALCSWSPAGGTSTCTRATTSPTLSSTHPWWLSFRLAPRPSAGRYRLSQGLASFLPLKTLPSGAAGSDGPTVSWRAKLGIARIQQTNPGFP